MYKFKTGWSARLDKGTKAQSLFCMTHSCTVQELGEAAEAGLSQYWLYAWCLCQSQFFHGSKRITVTLHDSNKVKMLAGSGRQKGGEWEEVDILENDKSKAACKYCIQIISAKIERVRTHNQKCLKRKDHYKEKTGQLLRERRGGREREYIKFSPYLWVWLADNNVTNRPRSNIVWVSGCT